MLYRTSTAILAVILALTAWGLVGYFARTISEYESTRVADARQAQLTTVMNAQAVRMRALALDTAPQGAKLKALLDVDIVSASYMIEEVGRAAGVKIKLGDAQPEEDLVSDGLTLKAVGFTVAADGKFQALLHAVRLLEALPIPSSVIRLDIERAPKSSGNASGLWHMDVYIRVLTTSDISS